MSHDAWFHGWRDQMAALHPRAFLETFAPTHETWHTFPAGNRHVGFLTFHKEIIAAFTESLSRVGWQHRLPPPWNQPPPFAYDPTLDAIDDLVSFSRAIEAWHNQIHHAWPEPGFMDARSNIRLMSFWSLHLLIDRKFDECLARNGIAFAAMDPALHPTV